MSLTRSLLPAALLGTLLLLPACAGTEEKVRRGLVNAGLSQGMAKCMAQPMSRELSLNQLMKLNSLSKARAMDRETSLEDFVRRTRALQDPEIMRVTARAATDCFIQRL